MNRILLCTLLQLSVVNGLCSHPSWGIEVDRTGTIYFADILHHGRGAVWKLSPKGTLALIAGDFHAHNVNLDAKGQVLSAHGEDHHLFVRFDADGKREVLLQGSYPTFNGGNAAYSPEGLLLFHAEHYIWSVDADGQRRKFHPQYLEWTQTLYPEPGGVVYVPEKVGKQARVWALCPDGTSVLWADNLIAPLDRPFDEHQDVLLGITKGCDGNLYICETAGRRILKVEGPGGIPSVFYRPSDGWTPCGITFFQGDAYILEYDLDRAMSGPQIIRVSEQGQRELLYRFEEAARQELPKDRFFGGRLWWAILFPFIIVVGGQWLYKMRKDPEK